MNPAGLRLVVSLAALTAGNMLSQLFRIVLGLVAPEVAEDIGLPPVRLGALSAVFFLVFALVQLPLGVALDRFGPRRTAATLFLSAALGCAVFASAQSFATAALGQALIALGCSPIYMSALVVVGRSTAPERFGSLAALLLAVASAGTILGATPLAVVVEELGWRGAFLVLAVVVLIVAAAIALLVRDWPPGVEAPVQQESLRETLQGVGWVLRLRTLWPLLPMLFASYAVVITFRGLWAGPYLADVYGLAPVPRGNALLVISLALIGGVLGFAALERRLDRRKVLVLSGAAITVVLLVVLALWPEMGVVPATLLMTVATGAGVSYSLLLAQGRRFIPDTLLGRGLTVLNTASILGVAVLQALSGLVVAAAPAEPPATRYTWLFAFLAVYLVVAALPYLRSSDAPLRG